jgi:hypothetical protein
MAFCRLTLFLPDGIFLSISPPRVALQMETTMATYTFKLFGKMHEAQTLADASKAFSIARDKSGRGSSSMPLPKIMLDGQVVGYFSYNGRIWSQPSKLWVPGATPIYDNAA